MSELDLCEKWTDSMRTGRPFIAYAEFIKAWKKYKRCRCVLCGHRIKVGELVRVQYTNDCEGAGGNPTLCFKCIEFSKTEVVEKMRAGHAEVKEGRLWWFIRQAVLEENPDARI